MLLDIGDERHIALVRRLKAFGESVGLIVPEAYPVHIVIYPDKLGYLGIGVSLFVKRVFIRKILSQLAKPDIFVKLVFAEKSRIVIINVALLIEKLCREFKFGISANERKVIVDALAFPLGSLESLKALKQRGVNSRASVGHRAVFEYQIVMRGVADEKLSVAVVYPSPLACDSLNSHGQTVVREVPRRALNLIDCKDHRKRRHKRKEDPCKHEKAIVLIASDGSLPPVWISLTLFHYHKGLLFRKLFCY